MNCEEDTEIARVHKELLDYCCLDTLALVKILERVREMVTEEGVR